MRITTIQLVGTSLRAAQLSYTRETSPLTSSFPIDVMMVVVVFRDFLDSTIKDEPWILC